MDNMILEIKHLSKSFGTHEVLKDIDFSVKKGDVTSIIGASGSGKSTLLRCINMLENASSGEILYHGENVLRRGFNVPSYRSRVGMVFQSFNLFPQYTALENVMLAEQLMAKERPDYKQNKKEILAQIEEHGKALLAQMGLSDRMDHYPHQLSGGQQQRVAIARALAMEPDILCFDEPTSALDPELTGEVLNVIRSLADHKTTMVIVTHEMAFARDVADHIIFMDGGVVVEQGPAKELIDNPKEERTKHFLGKYNK